jgi:4-hydroxy-tetrahydrodipicolinate synthase
MAETQRKLEGVIPALLIPYKENGRVDFKLLEKQTAYLLRGGIHGIFVNGSTGESAYVSTEEKAEVLKCVAGIARGKAALCAACIQPSTEQTLAELAVMEKLEPDFIVAVTPYYYKVSQDTIVDHYTKIAAATGVPVISYDIPSCTHNKIELATILKLAKIRNIHGIKDSSGDFVTFSRAISTPVKKGFAWIQGDDYLDAPSLLAGAAGIVTGTGNVWIDPYVEMYRAAQAGDTKAVNGAQKKINALCEIFQTVGGRVIPGIKAAAYLLGRSHTWMRQNSMTLSKADIDKVRGVLAGLKLL